jgi:hypothetical protein
MEIMPRISERSFEEAIEVAVLGAGFTEADKVFIQQLEEKLAGEPALTASVRANTPENTHLTFDYVVTDRLQGHGRYQFQILQTDHRRPRVLTVLPRLVVRAVPEDHRDDWWGMTSVQHAPVTACR